MTKVTVAIASLRGKDYSSYKILLGSFSKKELVNLKLS